MAERERLRKVVKRRSGFLLHSFVTVTLDSGQNEHYFLVPGQLLLPSLLFIKSWQLSHNFTCSPVEKLSVDFIASFFSPRGPTDLLRGLESLKWER